MLVRLKGYQNKAALKPNGQFGQLRDPQFFITTEGTTRTVWVNQWQLEVRLVL